MTKISCPNIEIEDLINRNILELSCEYQELSIDEEYEKKSFLISSDSNTLIGKPFLNIIVVCDKNNNIETVLSDFKGTIDFNFYKELLKKYGEPDKILKTKDYFEKNKKEENGILITQTKSELIECRFDENPLFLIWELEKYKVTFTLIHELDKTELVVMRL